MTWQFQSWWNSWLIIYYGYKYLMLSRVILANPILPAVFVNLILTTYGFDIKYTRNYYRKEVLP